MGKHESRNTRHSIKTMSSLDIMIAASSIVVGLVLLYGLISLSLLPAEVELGVFIVAVLILIGCYFCFRTRHPQTESEPDDASKNKPPVAEKKFPPMPDRTPTISTSSSSKSNQEDEEDVSHRLLTVLESIDQSNKVAEQRRIQEDEERHREQERISELMNSKTVHYDEIPGFIYFVKRGLWQMAAALFAFILVVNLSVADGVIDQGEFLFDALLLLACGWVSARAICDWRWMQRKIVGIRIKIWEPRSAFLLLFGGEAEASIFDCGNAVVKKTKYERFLLLRTATVSIDTPRKNAENDKDDGDVFNALENMRRPYEFRDIVMDLHEKLTMSQSNTIKRSGH